VAFQTVVFWNRRRYRVSTARATDGVRPRKKERPAPRSNAVEVAAWIIEPERDRSRLTVALMEPEGGARYVRLCREIRFTTSHPWHVRKSVSISADELPGVADVLEALR
jgi:hypothetical protein